ncbi:hypothetical protein [Aquimarina sp. AU474]|uniref:hypothetical protein n=1 Tax=Aquimarina sp. AU474 TaxID=2108529 RepID=UPI000D696F59|nr:hypothetical protein [Aquimarina sp. AU474]
MRRKKTILKLITFGAIIFFVGLFFRSISPKKTETQFSTIVKNMNNKEKPSYYFIGSSRVQKSINPAILREKFHNQNIYNLGISGSTFLSNSILTDFLIQNHTPKVIFVELSPIIQELSTGLIQFADEAELDIFKSIHELNKKENVLKKTRIGINTLNSYVFAKNPLKKDIKRILGVHHQKRNKKIVGFVPLDQNNFESTTPFITFNEINSLSIKNKDLSSYHNYINYLLELSSKHNTKLIFFLPITYKNNKEKNIVIPLYNSLPDSIKIKYSKKFIKNITNTKYLYDNNHLNNKGAEKYTYLLCSLIENYFTPK